MVICLYVHNTTGHVDKYWRCDVWKDSPLGFLDQADNKI